MCCKGSEANMQSIETAIYVFQKKGFISHIGFLPVVKPTHPSPSHRLSDMVMRLGADIYYMHLKVLHCF